MGKLNSQITFTGSISNLSAYQMRGVNGIVLRSKGGATREKIRTSPAFAQVRRNNLEFAGRAKASQWIMNMLRPQKALADYNIAGPLNAMLKPVQLLDNVSTWGTRHVQLSKNPQLLAGFSLNRNTLFDSVVPGLSFMVLSRTNRSAQVDVPALVPQVNFFPAKSLQWYSIVAVLGIVPDLFCNDGRYLPSSPMYSSCQYEMITTPWQPVNDSCPPATLQLQSQFTPPDDFFSLMLSVGIRYGSALNNEVVQAKHAGSAKILAMA